MICPSTGKEQHATYAEALAALMALKHAPFGHVYDCDECGSYHVTKARTVTREGQGRGRRKGATACR
jgi:hypothetical protein